MVALRQEMESQAGETEETEETDEDKQLREKVNKLEWESLRKLKVEAAKLNRFCRTFDSEKRQRDRVVRGLREMLHNPKEGALEASTGAGPASTSSAASRTSTASTSSASAAESGENAAKATREGRENATGS